MPLYIVAYLVSQKRYLYFQRYTKPVLLVYKTEEFVACKVLSWDYCVTGNWDHDESKKLDLVYHPSCICAVPGDPQQEASI